jgi:hypothetical protein
MSGGTAVPFPIEAAVMTGDGPKLEKCPARDDRNERLHRANHGFIFIPHRDLDSVS